MNDKRYRYILYLIVVVIIATVGLQGYWNFKNYQLNKQQLITDVQTSLDKVVDDYYANLAHNATIGLTFDSKNKKNVFKDGGILERISKSIDNNDSSFKGLDSLNLDTIEGITVIRGLQVDSLRTKKSKSRFPIWNNDSSRTSGLPELKVDSLRIRKSDPFEFLTSKVIVSISNDTLDVKKIDSLFHIDLKDKKIDLKYSLNYNKPIKSFPSFFAEKEQPKTNKIDSLQNSNLLNVVSKSTFLPKGSELKVEFQNANWAAFKRGINAVLISILLLLAVIGCLFFLLKIIKEQKQLAEVKNDLISNITHEFKTPIATIGVALEGINSFNVIKDKAKTKKYVDMSADQLSKLNLMVEKLLETATLDSESLNFNKEDLNISQLLDSLVNRYQSQHQEKTFHSYISDENLIIQADPFHFENALNNILDNAVKYGGDVISIAINKVKNAIEISISDNGTSLKQDSKQRIFEKFYRVPKGNTHDVKGYGIGLYYTKTIINKHDGDIALDLNNNLTTFKISLPNG
ncbi:MAG: sensor histidine kinase [Jejuia sp.]